MMVLFSMATMRGPFTGTVMTFWPRAEVYTRTPWQDVTATSFIGKAGAKPLAFLKTRSRLFPKAVPMTEARPPVLQARRERAIGQCRAWKIEFYTRTNIHGTWTMFISITSNMA